MGLGDLKIIRDAYINERRLASPDQIKLKKFSSITSYLSLDLFIILKILIKSLGPADPRVPNVKTCILIQMNPGVVEEGCFIRWEGLNVSSGGKELGSTLVAQKLWGR